MTSPAMTAETIELLQTLIRNGCINDGTPSSGFEHRNADTLHAFLGGAGFDVERFEPTEGRVSLVARMEGRDPSAPSLCLMGHTDVVPVNPEGWSRDPFGGELRLDGAEVWGRGAIDMLNLTVVDGGRLSPARTRRVPAARRPHLLRRCRRGVGQRARRPVDGRPRARRDPGRLRAHRERRTSLGAERGAVRRGATWARRAWPGDGCACGERPATAPRRSGSDNALVKAAAVVQRLADYRPAPRFHELWRERVDTLGVDDELAAMLLDPAQVDEVLAAMPNPAAAAYLHACTHTTFSPNVSRGAVQDERDPRLHRHRGRRPHAARRAATTRCRPTSTRRSATSPTRSRSRSS